MFFSKRRIEKLDIWPGFVDALSTVLMAIILVLMTFVIAQLYLTEALNQKENDVSGLQKKLKSLENLVDNQEKINLSLRHKTNSFKELIRDLNQKMGDLDRDLAYHKQQLLQKDQLHTSLLKDGKSLESSVKTLTQTLTLFEKNHDALEQELKSLRQKIETLSAEQLVQDYEQQQRIKKLQNEIHLLTQDNQALIQKKEKVKEEKEFDYYRSEFFSKLLKILGTRPDIKVVGDRFVFQSEVLFDLASADLGLKGKKSLDALIEALNELDQIIPKNLGWILRIDGHTDRLPIKSSQFPSNWELSAARSIAVVKYMMSKGVHPERLVAAAFGEYQPLTTSENLFDLAKNRRIEFKLDQK